MQLGVGVGVCVCVCSSCVVRACARYRVDSKLTASVIVRSLHTGSEGHWAWGWGFVLVHFIHITKAGGGRMRREGGRVWGEGGGRGGLTENKYSLLLACLKLKGPSRERKTRGGELTHYHGNVGGWGCLST